MTFKAEQYNQCQRCTGKSITTPLFVKLLNRPYIRLVHFSLFSKISFHDSIYEESSVILVLILKKQMVSKF